MKIYQNSQIELNDQGIICGNRTKQTDRTKRSKFDL